MSDLIMPVLWEAFFDESGKLADPAGVVCFGGCTGPSSAIAKFSSEWEQALREHGVADTSMKDAIHFHGAYESWKLEEPEIRERKRDLVLTELAKILAGSALLMIASPMTSADFQALPHQQREKFWHDVQYGGLEACIMGILDQSPEIVVHAVCDLSEQYAQKCVTLFNKLRSRNAAIKARCFAITFADDKRTSCLQAADMVAYCSRADHLRESKQPSPIVEKLIAILHQHGGSTEHYLWKANGDGLGHGEVERDVPS